MSYSKYNQLLAAWVINRIKKGLYREISVASVVNSLLFLDFPVRGCNSETTISPVDFDKEDICLLFISLLTHFPLFR